MRRWRLGGVHLAVACLIAGSCASDAVAPNANNAAQPSRAATAEAPTAPVTTSPSPIPTEAPHDESAQNTGPCDVPDQTLPAGDAHIAQRRGDNGEAVFEVLTANGLLNPIICPPRFTASAHLNQSSLLLGDGEGASAVLVNVGGRIEQRQVTDANGDVVHPMDLMPFSDRHTLVEVDGELLSLDHETLRANPIPNVEGQTFLGTGGAYSSESAIVRTDAGYHVGPRTTPEDLTFVSDGGSAWDLGPAHFVISSLDGATRTLLFVEVESGEVVNEVSLAPTTQVGDSFGPLIGIGDNETGSLYGPTGDPLDDAVVTELAAVLDPAVDFITTRSGQALVGTSDGEWVWIEADGTTRSAPSLAGARAVDAFAGYFYIGPDSGDGELVRIDAVGAIETRWPLSGPAFRHVVTDHQNGWITLNRGGGYLFVNDDGRTFEVPEESSTYSTSMDIAGSYVVRNPGASEIAVHLVQDPLSEVLRFDGDLVGHLLPG